MLEGIGMENFDQNRPKKDKTAKQKWNDFTKATGEAAKNVAGKAADAASKSQQVIVSALDANGDEKIDINDIIILGLRTPGIRVDRAAFLRAEFRKRYLPEVIEDAIKHTPAHAKIPREEIDKIADDVIQFERNCVSGISTVLGMPGGAAVAATIPVDIIQYYGYMLRATQKLLYLYGFPEIDTTEENLTFDSETVNLLILCMGVMYGAAGANQAIQAMARGLAVGVEKKLLKTALTKGTVYPVVKSVSHWFGQNMTKQIFAGFFKKAIPVVGGVIGGGITYISFKPCCDKLKASLQNTILTDPHAKGGENDMEIEADVVDITDEPAG